MVQQQSPCFPNDPMMIPEAHPTPARTVIAPAGQLRAQAPHSMQASRSVILALPSFIAKIAWGQTATHMPQPIQPATSSLSVVTPVM